MTSLIMLTGDPAAQVGGYTISVVGYIIVFAALITLVVIFIFIPKVIQHFISLELKKNNLTKKEIAEPTEAVKDANINVAIAMGLHLYFNELHDSESNVITIRNAQKQYSPWSSKIYGVSNQPIKINSKR